MKFKNQNITDVERGLIVHGVNCMGVMNSGAALAIRTKWPETYDIYKKMPVGEEMLGTTHIIRVGLNLYVANCYTQFQFGYDGDRYADLEAVEKCLADCFAFVGVYELPLCAVKIASDRGGLDWDSEVEPIFKRLNSEYKDIPVTIYYIQE